MMSNTKTIWLFLLILSGFLSCKNQATKQEKVKDELTFEDRETPFLKAAYIEVISYPARSFWDTQRYDDGGINIYEEIVTNGKLRFDTTKIKDKIQLTDSLRHILYETLYSDICSQVEQAACYDPRHAFLLYDDKGMIIEHIEVCLECMNAHISAGLAYPNFCSDKTRDLNAFLQKIGVKYYGDGEEEFRLSEAAFPESD